MVFKMNFSESDSGSVTLQGLTDHLQLRWLLKGLSDKEHPGRCSALWAVATVLEELQKRILLAKENS